MFVSRAGSYLCSWSGQGQDQSTFPASSCSDQSLGLAVFVSMIADGVAIACPFCGRFVDTELFTDEGVGRALG